MRLRPGGPGDAEACAAILNDWIDAADWVPRVHPPAEVTRFHRVHVFAVCEVTVAEMDGRVAGYLAVDAEGFVAALYVAAWARGQGVGARLVAAAKAARPGGLALFALAANAGARRFYAREGFVETGGTAGENDEGLPDVRLEWRAGR